MRGSEQFDNYMEVLSAANKDCENFRQREKHNRNTEYNRNKDVDKKSNTLINPKQALEKNNRV